MRPPRNAVDYRNAILDYEARSYTKTMFQGLIYRFLAELLRNDDNMLPEKYPDIDAYNLAHLSTYDAQSGVGNYESSRFTFSKLHDLLKTPLPRKGQSQILFLCGHLPGNWIASLGAKYGIAPEFFRRHIHLWRSSQGTVLHRSPRLPSEVLKRALTLRVNTIGVSTSPFVGGFLPNRRKILPEAYILNPERLDAAPGSSLARGHAFISESEFLIEQDISVSIETDGEEGWTGQSSSLYISYYRFC